MSFSQSQSQYDISMALLAVLDSGTEQNNMTWNTIKNI